MGLFRLPHAPAFTQVTNVLMFVQSMKFIETHSGRNDNVSIGYLRQRLAGVSASTSSWPLQPVELRAEKSGR